MSCSMCNGLGWILEANGAGLLQDPAQAELIPCILPDCEHSSRPLASVCFKGIEFRHVSKHPAKGFVMSVSDPAPIGAAA